MVVPASEGSGEVLHVQLKMGEEIDILACLEGIKSVDSAIDGRVDEDLASRGGKGCLLNRGDHFSNVKAADLLHLERSPVQIPIFPPELVRVGVVLEVLFSIYITSVLL